MNSRVLIHILAAVATAVAGGTVVFAGVSDVASHNIVAVAVLVGIIASTFLAATTTGEAKG